MPSIFDLDGTLICSKHRQLTLPDGSLDLAHWVENNTPQKIAADSLLPLVKLCRFLYQQGNEIILCTARVMGEADYLYLLENNIPHHHVLSRPEGCTMPDADLKDIRLRIFADEQAKRWPDFAANAVMWDDNAKVLARMESMGIVAHNAVNWNRAVQRKMVAA